MRQETNKFIRLWIWTWYNDYTRLFVVMLPSYFVILIPLLHICGLPDKYMMDTILSIYVIILMMAFCDNDYSNLRRIGLNEYRRKLTPQEMDE